MTRTLLVTGGDGQLAHDVARRAEAADWSVVSLNRSALNICDNKAVRELVDAQAPNVIVNCAAWTAVDDCELDPERAMAINGTAVSHLVEAAENVGAHLIQMSTDYVFSGDLPDGEWQETDTPDPQTAYGRSKLVGEQSAAGHTVVRTSWLSGAHGPNIVKTILRLGAGTDDLHFVDDQRGKPTFSADLSTVIVRLADAQLGGIFHVTNDGAVSWWQFAREVMAAAGHDPDRVRAVRTTDQRPVRPAARPANSALANTALIARDMGPALRDFREPLKELVAQIQAA